VIRPLLALALALAAQTASGLDIGPQSSACRDALAALDERESALAAAAQPQAHGRIAADAQWQLSRANAAKACLGQEGAASAPLPHSALPPIAVPPVVVAPAPVRAPSAAPPPAVSIPRPPVVTSCDPNGCWTSDGSRMPHAGRDPLDPRVRCSVQGKLVVCL
jgi:hypothetical protein